jgi:hypothetical protein
LYETLWRLSAKTFIPAGFCQLATVLCQVSIPLLVRELLKVLDANPRKDVTRESIPFAVGIFLASFSATQWQIIGIKDGYCYAVCSERGDLRSTSSADSPQESGA